MMRRILAAGGLLLSFLQISQAVQPVQADSSWATLTSGLTTARQGLAAATAPCPGSADTCVYAIGGLNSPNDTKPLSSVEYDDLDSAAGWTILPSSLTTRRAYPAAVTAACPASSAVPTDTCLYAIGGLNIAGSLSSVEYYDPEGTAGWKSLSSGLVTARYDLAAVTGPCPSTSTSPADSCMYAIGGEDNSSNAIASVEYYDPRGTDGWKTLSANLNTGRWALGAVTARCPAGGVSTDSCIYAIGGFNYASGDAQSSVEYYDPAGTGGWNMLSPSLPAGRWGLAAAAAVCPGSSTDTCIYTLGGDYGGYGASVQYFNPQQSGSWQTLPSGLPDGLTALAATLAPCPAGAASAGACIYAIYAIGGIEYNTLQSSVEYYDVDVTPTTLTPGSASSIYGGTATAAATLAAGTITPTDQTVSFSLTDSGSKQVASCSDVTDSNGTAKCALNPAGQPVFPAGSYTLTMSFAGQGTYLPASTSTGYTINPAPITVSANPQGKVYGQPDPILSYSTSNGSLVNGDQFTGSLSRAAGDHVGDYAITQGSLAITNNGQDVTKNYAITFRSSTFSITPAPLTIRANDQSTTYGAISWDTSTNAMTFNTLVNGDAPPALGSGLTITSNATPGSPAGQYALTPTSAGDPDYTYTYKSGTLTVQRRTLSLALATPAFLASATPTLAATLSAPAANTGPLDGLNVTLTLGSGTGAPSCQGQSDAAGKASCQLRGVLPLGPQPVVASFGGDGNNNPASAVGQTTVFQLPTSSAFVLGDVTAATAMKSSSTVTFWGASWAGQNSLSGGTAPSAFKGFAGSIGSLTPGATWTATTGNSTTLPSSVPAYLGVIVTGKATQSGNTISGTIVHVVVVKTNAGYANDPGHPGTGTIVGQIF